MLRSILRLLAFAAFLPCAVLPLAAHAQDRPYSAPVVLQVTAPVAAQPITVTVQISLTLPADGHVAQIPLTVTQATASAGSVQVVSARPAQPVEGGRAVALTPGASPLTGLLATPTPQPPAAPATSDKPVVEPMAGAVNDAANLRMGPGTSYAVAGKAQAGDAVQVVGKSANGEWYKLAGGEWIAAFLVDMEGAAALAVVDAPSVEESWPRYEMISGAFSFAYPPHFSVAEEEEDSVTLTSGAMGFDPTLQIAYISAGSLPDLRDYDAAVRKLKAKITQVNGFDHRFTGEGIIDAERGSIYLTGIATSDDDVDISFVTAAIPAGGNYALVWYLRIGAADIEAEALPILRGVARSVRTSSGYQG